MREKNYYLGGYMLQNLLSNTVETVLDDKIANNNTTIYYLVGFINVKENLVVFF